MTKIFVVTIIAVAIFSGSFSAFANQDPAGYTKAYSCGLKDVTVVSKGKNLFLKEVNDDGDAQYHALKLVGPHVNMGSNRYVSEIGEFETSSGITVSFQLRLKGEQVPHLCQPSLAL